MARGNYEQAKYFTLAFCNAFIVFSLLALGTAMVPLGGVTEGAAPADTPQEGVPVEDFYKPRPEDSICVLLTARAQSGEACFVLAALDVEQGSLTARYLPSGLVVRYRGGEERLAELYGRDGPLAVKEALAGTLNIAVDRWMAFLESGLTRAADVFGPVSYSPGGAGPVLDSGAPAAKEQYRLDGAALCELVFSPESDAGEIEAAVEAYLYAALRLVQQPEADDAFRAVVDLADSDVSYFDYDSRREALCFMAALLQ